MSNEVVNAILERRSVNAFLPSELDKNVLEQILNAGRWAPSWTNSQPWSFVVITNKELKRKIGAIGSRKTFYSKAPWMEDAAVIIVVVVDPDKDPFHYVEDGAIAAQNMALAAHSLGYASYYLGIFELEKKEETAEAEVKKLLQIPSKMRVVAVLPIGISEKVPQSSRKDLIVFTHYNRYAARNL
jgi:nitroreductase